MESIGSAAIVGQHRLSQRQQQQHTDAHSAFRRSGSLTVLPLQQRHQPLSQEEYLGSIRERLSILRQQRHLAQLMASSPAGFDNYHDTFSTDSIGSADSCYSRSSQYLPSKRSKNNNVICEFFNTDEDATYLNKSEGVHLKLTAGRIPSFSCLRKQSGSCGGGPSGTLAKKAVSFCPQVTTDE